MQVRGQIRTSCPPEIFLSAMRDPKVLSQLLPPGSKLEQGQNGALAFVLNKTFGPIRLTLPGQLTLTPTGEGHNQTLSARASHNIGGMADLDLDLVFDLVDGKTLLDCTGNLVATGIAGRVLRERQNRVNQILKGLLLRLKVQAEQEMRKARTGPVPA